MFAMNPSHVGIFFKSLKFFANVVLHEKFQSWFDVHHLLFKKIRHNQKVFEIRKKCFWSRDNDLIAGRNFWQKMLIIFFEFFFWKLSHFINYKYLNCENVNKAFHVTFIILKMSLIK